MPTYGAGHVNVVIPVSEELKKLGATVVILGLTTACSTLDKQNIPYKKLKDYLFLYEKKELLKIEEIGEKLAKENHDNDLVSFEDTKYYYGIGMYSLILEKGEETAYDLYSKGGRKSFEPLDFMNRVLKFEKANVVTTTCNVRYEKAATTVGRYLGIQTILFYDFLDEFYEGTEKFNFVFCLNEFQKHQLLEKGIEKEKIHVIGQPAFDSLFKVKPNRIQMAQDLNMKVLKNLVLWICSEFPTVEGMLEIYREIQLAAKNLTDYVFIIKVHPNRDGGYFTNSNNIYVVKNYDIQKIICNADLVIGTMSTSVHEAMLLDKPIIIPNYLNEDYGFASQYYKTGGTMYLEDKGSLLGAIRELISSEDLQNKYIENRIRYKIEPEGSVKAANFIIKQGGVNR